MSGERAVGIKAATHGSGVRLDVVELKADGKHEKVLHIDYTREQATAVVAGVMRCMGIEILFRRPDVDAEIES